MKTILIVVAVAVLMVLPMACTSNGDADQGDKKTTDESAAKRPDDTKGDKMNAADPADMRHAIRSEDNQFVTIQTDFGDMVLELYHDVAPGHADSFAARSTEGFYDGLIFHRIISGFMIQGGDPQGTGMGNAGYYLDAEFSDIKHLEGTLSMARSRDINSASCQFFICLGPARNLDNQYTVFGQLIKGYDILRKIGTVEVMAPPNNPREKSKPVEEVKMRKLFLSDAEGVPLDKE